MKDADVGLVINGDGRALEASGSLFLEAGGAFAMSADTVAVRWNETGAAFTSEEITAEGAVLHLLRPRRIF